MRGISCFLVFLWLGIFSMYAQTDRDLLQDVKRDELPGESREKESYWTVSLSGGGTLYQGEWNAGMNKTDLIAPYGKLSVARWFSPVWGIRVQADGGLLRNGVIKMNAENSKGEFSFIDGYVGVITNIMNWGTDKRANRPFSVYLHIGGGMAWTPSRKELPAKISPALLLGGQMNVRLTDSWSVGLEIDGTIVKDDFNSHTGGRKYEGYAGVAIGLVYRFFKK